MKEKRKILTGICLGALACVALLGNIYLFKKITGRVLNLLDRSDDLQKKQFGSLLSGLSLSFEREEEMYIFEPEHVGMQVSDYFATDGKKSLLVEFPPVTDYPGITFELSGKFKLDWRDMKEFTFDVYNTVPMEKVLIIQIRSGEHYPKRQFKKEVTLKAQGLIKVTVTKEELADKVNLETISHLTLFMSKPETTFRVYIDNLRVVKDENN